MKKHAKQLHARMSEAELARAHALASSLDMTLSDLIRALIQLPAERVGDSDKALLVVDRNAVRALARETRHWGYQYNQVVKALNTIALCLRRDVCGSSEAMGELQKVADKLDALDEGMAKLSGEAAEITSQWLAAI